VVHVVIVIAGGGDPSSSRRPPRLRIQLASPDQSERRVDRVAAILHRREVRVVHVVAHEQAGVPRGLQGHELLVVAGLADGRIESGLVELKPAGVVGQTGHHKGALGHVGMEKDAREQSEQDYPMSGRHWVRRSTRLRMSVLTIMRALRSEYSGRVSGRLLIQYLRPRESSTLSPDTQLL